MKAEEFYNNLRNGVYKIPVKPKRIPDYRNLEYDAYREVPEIINEKRSVKWNREKREQLVREKVAKIVNEYEELKYQWMNTEKELIIKYHNDRIEMYAEETGFNHNQIEHIISVLYHVNICRFSVDEEDFPSFKKMMLDLKKIPEIS